MSRWLKPLLFAASIAFLSLALIKTYHRLPRGSLHVRPGPAVVALLLVSLGVSWTAAVWRSLLAARKIDLPFSESLRIVSLSALGKYLPGSFWQPLGWVGLAREAGVAVGVGSVTVAMTLVISLAAALTVGPILLASSRAAGAFVWMLIIVPVALAALHPRVLGDVLSRVSKFTKRPGLNVGGIAFDRVLFVLGVAIPSWLLFGAGLYETSHALHLTTNGGWALLTGAFAVAWSVGFLAIPVPGGLGIREAVLLVLLRVAYSTPEALLLAVAFRLVFILAESIMTGIALGIPKRRVRERLSPGSS